MKFKDMPYERVDFDAVEKELRTLMAEFEAAKSGEEQFEIHKKYYELEGKVSTLYTISHIRFDIDTTDKFYEAEHEYYDEKLPVFSNLVLEYQEKCTTLPTEIIWKAKSVPWHLRTWKLPKRLWMKS